MRTDVYNYGALGTMATDVKNAGALWVDKEVVVDQGLITSRNPGEIIEEMGEGRHERRAVA